MSLRQRIIMQSVGELCALVNNEWHPTC